MPAQQAKETLLELVFPLAGLDESAAFGKQRKNTCADAQNVRGFEPSTQRLRGAQRPGLGKYSATQLASGASLQDLSAVTYTATGSTMVSGRNVVLCAVAGGKLYTVAVAGGAATLRDAAFLSASQEVVFSDSNLQVMYYTDGLTYKKYTPSTTTAAAWAASSGTLPASAGDKARLICTWRSRTVLSGLLGDGHNWFMSAVNDSLNYDYSPATTVETQAVAGNNSTAGKVGDIVQCIIPYSDDVLIFGCDHSIWQMSGDPMAGGRIDLLSDAIGMPFGRPWCKDPYGNLYFMSNRMGLFKLEPGQVPVRISQPLDKRFQSVNPATYMFRLAWDDRMQGVWLFVTKASAAAATTHYFWEARTNAWWPDVFASTNYNPKCCLAYDGDDPNDRALLVGSWDGYVRTLRDDFTKDDGTAISSTVTIGPLLTKDMDDVLLKELQCVLAVDSSDVTWEVLVGKTAEAALASDPVASGTWTSDNNDGRNFTSYVRKSGWAVYVRLSASGPWAMESIRAKLLGTGRVRQRG